jgi:hypothetical protein
MIKVSEIEDCQGFWLIYITEGLNQLCVLRTPEKIFWQVEERELMLPPLRGGLSFGEEVTNQASKDYYEELIKSFATTV